MVFSLITATYNAAVNLRHCLDSIAAQTVPCEHILVDGGSTDGTVPAIEEYVARRGQAPDGARRGQAPDGARRGQAPDGARRGQAPDGARRGQAPDGARRGQAPDGASPRVCFISEPDRGLYDALNKGIRMATGDIIGILHADDFYPSTDILAKVAKIFENPDVEACYGDLLYVRDGSVEKLNCAAHVELSPAATLNRLQTSSGGFDSTIQQFNESTAFKTIRYWQSGPFDPEKFKWGWMPPHPTFFVRREVYERHGLFRLDLGTAADYELMLRFLLKQRIRCAYLSEVLMCMRVGGASNRSLQARLKANRMDRKAWAVNGLRPYPWTIVMKPLRKVSQWWQRP